MSTVECGMSLTEMIGGNVAIAGLGARSPLSLLGGALAAWKI